MCQKLGQTCEENISRSPFMCNLKSSPWEEIYVAYVRKQNFRKSILFLTTKVFHMQHPKDPVI